MRLRGVEPPRPFGHEHLKLARLPFRHSRVVANLAGSERENPSSIVYAVAEARAQRSSPQTESNSCEVTASCQGGPGVAGILTIASSPAATVPSSTG